MKTLTEILNENLIFESANINDWVKTLKQYLRDYKNEGAKDFSTKMALYDTMKDDKVLSAALSPILKSKRSKIQWCNIDDDKHDSDGVQIIFGTFSASWYSSDNFVFRVKYSVKKDTLILNFVDPEYVEWQEKFAKGLKVDKLAEFVEEVRKSAKKELPANPGIKGQITFEM